MKALLCLLCFLSCLNAGDFYTTKDNIKARGIDFSFTVPDGMNKIDTGTVQAWVTRTQGMQVFINLSMFKHHMHTNEEKMEEIKKQERRNPPEQFLHTMRRKIGNEPAVITEYTYESTNSDGRRVEYQVLELVLFPGDTAVKLTCQVSQADYGSGSLKENISAIRPILLKMLDSVDLN